MRRAFPRLGATGLLLLLLPGARAYADDFDSYYRKYREEIRRPALIKRTRARVRLADTGDPRAMDVLLKEYRRPEQPKLQVRYLIAQIVTDAFAAPQYLPALREWRARHKKPVDAWLWYRTLSIPEEEIGTAEPLGVARDRSLDVFLRAAALEAVAWRAAPAMLEAVPGLVDQLPDAGVDRAVLLESATSVLSRYREWRTKPELVPAFEKLCDAMDAPTTLPRTHIVMARRFARLLDVPYHWRETGKWREELKIIQAGGKVSSAKGYASGPTFAGLEATGDRIVYLIDMSDSMLEPLTPAELSKLPKGPITGRSNRREKESKDARWKKAFEGASWKDVKNRFDAARALLKASLLQLDEDQSFCVIGFGDKAETLKSTPGLTKATIGGIRKVMAELDGVRSGPKADGRPHGTLAGKTNMHGGFLLSFRVTGRRVGPGEYVNKSTFEAGCDTIFLLSDGDPTWDDYDASDRADEDDQAGDPEMGAYKLPDSDSLHFSGPYRRGFFLVSDVRRLNLFRKAQIHCVGMGEANMGLLQSLAAIGLGEAVSLRSGK